MAWLQTWIRTPPRAFAWVCRPALAIVVAGLLVLAAVTLGIAYWAGFVARRLLRRLNVLPPLGGGAEEVAIRPARTFAGPAPHERGAAAPPDPHADPDAEPEPTISG